MSTLVTMCLVFGGISLIFLFIAFLLLYLSKQEDKSLRNTLGLVMFISTIATIFSFSAAISFQREADSKYPATSITE